MLLLRWLVLYPRLPLFPKTRCDTLFEDAPFSPQEYEDPKEHQRGRNAEEATL